MATARTFHKKTQQQTSTPNLNHTKFWRLSTSLVNRSSSISDSANTLSIPLSLFALISARVLPVAGYNEEPYVKSGAIIVSNWSVLNARGNSVLVHPFLALWPTVAVISSSAILLQSPAVFFSVTTCCCCLYREVMWPYGALARLVAPMNDAGDLSSPAILTSLELTVRAASEPYRLMLLLLLLSPYVLVASPAASPYSRFDNGRGCSTLVAVAVVLVILGCSNSGSNTFVLSAGYILL